MDLSNVYGIFHPTSAQYTFFSAARGTISKINHMLGHKEILSKYMKIKIIPCILSDIMNSNYKSATKTTLKNMQTSGS
jgi:hypothetical protein